MSHENSETVQFNNGDWVNINSNTKKVLIPRTEQEKWVYNSATESIKRAIERSASFDYDPVYTQKEPPPPDYNELDLLDGLTKLRKALGYKSSIENMGDIKTSPDPAAQFALYLRFLLRGVSDTAMSAKQHQITGSTSKMPIWQATPMPPDDIAANRLINPQILTNQTLGDFGK